MKKAIIWGAGRIGRGFVADLLHEGGYFIEFVDIDRALVDTLNSRGRYSIHKADASGIRREVIEGGFRAHLASDELSSLFLQEDCLVDVAVFKNDLEAVADMLAPYIALRAAKMPESALDIITNVNMVSPELAFRGMLEKRLVGAAREYLDRRMGISGIFMMCISPDAKPEMLTEDPLAVYNNGFFEQAVDAHAFRGKKPDAPRMRLSDRLEAEEARKLYTLNMAHCALAYLGTPQGYKTSFEAVNDPAIAEILGGALDEAGTGLAAEFGFSEAETAEWKAVIFDLLLNPYMADPLSRLGADTRRKLSGNDRLMMPAKLCLKAGTRPVNLARIIRAGYAFENDDPGTRHVRGLVSGVGLENALCDTGSINKDTELARIIIQEEC